MKDLTPENNFDELVRNNLEGFEMPHDATAWARFESKLAPQPTPSLLNPSLMKGAAAALVIGGIAAASYLLWPSATTDATLVAEKQRIEASTLEPVTESAPHEVERTVPTASNEKESKTAVKAEVKDRSVLNEDKSSVSLTEGDRSQGMDNRQSQVGVNVNDAKPESENVPNQSQAALNLAIKMSKSTVCVGEEVQLMAVTGTGGLEFAWHFSDGEKRSRTEAVRNFDTPGTYEVRLVASRGEQTWERNANVQVQPLPMAEFDMARPIPGIPIYELSITLAEGELCRWTFSDGRVSNEPNTRQLFRRRGDAQAELMVTNAFGCSSVVKQSEYIAEDFRLLAPNTFSPNGDGTNDDFIPMALKELECDFEMLIRDLTGREIYRTSNVKNPWNGRENNTGNILPTGLYIWTVVLKDDVLKDKVFSGEITLQQ